jgi:hypothetical protein
MSLSLALLAACGASTPQSSNDAAGVAPDAGGGGLEDGGEAAADAGAPDSGASDSGGPATYVVQFTYRPGWEGAEQVAVHGAFGQATDWMQPLAILTKDGAGVFVGSADLPAGRYPYLFRVKGDAASPRSTFMRYSLDPTNPVVEACPATSPTYSMQAANPCSILDLTAGPPATRAPRHVRSSVTYDGQGTGGYLVVIERLETGLHHYFVNRATSASDGMFDLSVAPGRYRFQVLHPTFLSQTDDQRDPMVLQAARRVLSSTFMVMDDLDVPPAETAYHTYSQMMPRTSTQTLPTEFVLAVNPGDTGAKVEVYGSPVGDPFFASRTSTATSVAFDGHFNTSAARTASVALGRKYYWGTEQVAAHADGEVRWTVQSMVFPITWR